MATIRFEVDARRHLQTLVGTTIHTIALRQPNTVVRIDGDVAVVATRKSPRGQPVEVAWVQEAIDRLVDQGELEMTTAALGSPIGHRSAFLGAALSELPGAMIVSRRPPRLRLKVST